MKSVVSNRLGLLALVALVCPFSGLLNAQVVDIRVVDETAPAGGLAVILVELTEPKPISGGQARFRFDAGFLDSVRAGAVLHSTFVTSQLTLGSASAFIEFSSADASFGTDPELPIMVFAVPVNPSALPGQTAQITLDLSESVFRDPQGQVYAEETNAGTLTVGGFSITDMLPVQGLVRAGETIIFEGVGFPAELDVNLSGANIGTVEVVSSEQVRVTLGSDFNLLPTTRVRFRDEADFEEIVYPAVFLDSQVVGDSDADGVEDAVEDGAPNQGDGNGDGLLDRQQPEVASLVASTGADYVTLVAPPGTVLSQVEAVENPSPQGTPSEVSFPLGIFQFVLNGLDPGASSTLTLLLPAGIHPSAYYKFGSTPQEPAAHWYDFSLEEGQGAEIQFDRILLHLKDGARGDDDLTANGQIVEPGAPAFVRQQLSFPQFVNGGPGGPNRSRIIVRNNSSLPVSGQILFSNPDGTPAQIPIAGVTDDAHPFSIGGWGTLDMETDGTGNLSSGVARVVTETGDGNQVVATEVFSILGSFVSVNSSPERDRQQIFVSVDPDPERGEDTGIAAYNPDPVRAAQLQATLVNHQGQVVGVRNNILLGPGEQLIGFVSQEAFFADFFSGRAEAFVGTLNLAVTSGPSIAVVGLIQKNSNGALIAVSTSPNTFVASP